MQVLFIHQNQRTTSLKTEKPMHPEICAHLKISLSHTHTHTHTQITEWICIYWIAAESTSAQVFFFFFASCLYSLHVSTLSYGAVNLICSGVKPPNKLSGQNGKHLCRFTNESPAHQPVPPPTSQNSLECLWTFLPEESQIIQRIEFLQID